MTDIQELTRNAVLAINKSRTAGLEARLAQYKLQRAQSDEVMEEHGIKRGDLLNNGDGKYIEAIRIIPGPRVVGAIVNYEGDIKRNEIIDEPLSGWEP